MYLCEGMQRIDYEKYFHGVEVARCQRGERSSVSTETLPVRKSEERSKTVEVIPALVVSQPQIEISVSVANNPSQPVLLDFRLYKCTACRKMVLGFDGDNHLIEAHQGKGVEWKRMR
jgi:hypothetical protein